MDQVIALIDYFRAEPRVALGVALGIVGLYLLLQRKSRLARDADARLSSLHREKTGKYNSLRPPH